MNIRLYFSSRIDLNKSTSAGVKQSVDIRITPLALLKDPPIQYAIALGVKRSAILEGRT